MPLRAVVFDFDGVIADSEPLHFEGFRRVLARQGVALSKSEYYEKYLGFDDAGAFRAVLGDHGQAFDDGRITALVAAKLALFPDVIAGQSVIYEGAADVHRAAGRRGAARHRLGRDARRHRGGAASGTGLRERFRTVVAAEHTPRSKPHPDPYLRAVEMLREQGDIAAEADPRARRRHRGFAVGPAIGARRRAAHGRR